MKYPSVIESHANEPNKKRRKKSLASFHWTVLGNLLYLSRVIVDLQAINRRLKRLDTWISAALLGFSLQIRFGMCWSKHKRAEINKNRLIFFNNTPRNNGLRWAVDFRSFYENCEFVRLVSVSGNNHDSHNDWPTITYECVKDIESFAGTNLTIHKTIKHDSGFC